MQLGRLSSFLWWPELNARIQPRKASQFIVNSLVRLVGQAEGMSWGLQDWRLCTPVCLLLRLMSEKCRKAAKFRNCKHKKWRRRLGARPQDVQKCTTRFVQIAAVSKWPTQMTLWHSNGHVTRFLLARWWTRGNYRLRFVGQLMNHLMENAIPDFRFVCPWPGLSLRFMSPLVFCLPFRSILNCCFSSPWVMGFYWPHAMWCPSCCIGCW